MILVLLVASILIPVVTMAVMGEYDTETQWIIADINSYVININMGLIIYLLVAFRRTLLKILAAFLLMTNIWWTIDYVILQISESTIARNVNDVIFLFIAFPIIVNILLKPYNSITKYRPDGIFSVYKKPKNSLAVLVAVVTGGYGARSIVKYGVEFIFKGGELIYRNYKPREEHIYVEIENIPIEKEVGTKWSLFNNCCTCGRQWLRKT